MTLIQKQKTAGEKKDETNLPRESVLCILPYGSVSEWIMTSTVTPHWLHLLNIHLHCHHTKEMNTMWQGQIFLVT